MCNMGSTFMVMGLPIQAFEFWWKALRTQPTFWDVLVRSERRAVPCRSSNPPTGQHAHYDPWVEPLGG